MLSHADAYQRFMGRWSRALARSFVACVDVGDADAILDVGSGTGAVTAELASASKSARVTGIDPAPAYVAEAARRIGDPRVDLRVGDATQLDFRTRPSTPAPTPRR